MSNGNGNGDGDGDGDGGGRWGDGNGDDLIIFMISGECLLVGSNVIASVAVAVAVVVIIVGNISSCISNTYAQQHVRDARRQPWQKGPPPPTFRDKLQ